MRGHVCIGLRALCTVKIRFKLNFNDEQNPIKLTIISNVDSTSIDAKAASFRRVLVRNIRPTGSSEQGHREGHRNDPKNGHSAMYGNAINKK